jgi:hypothetical protein
MPKWILLFFALCCCTKETTVPEQNQLNLFTTIYSEYLVTMASDTARMDLKESYLQAILKKNNMSHQQFESIRLFLQTHPQLFDKMLGQTSEKLQKELATKKSAK